MNKTKDYSSTNAAIQAYAVFFSVLVGETFLVKEILALAKYQLHVSWFGPWLAWIVFVLGASVLALFELRPDYNNQEPHDPFQCWSWSIQRRLGLGGVIINSVVFGPLFTAIALKRGLYPDRVILTIASSVLFSTVWVPLFVFIWR